VATTRRGAAIAGPVGRRSEPLLAVPPGSVDYRGVAPAVSLWWLISTAQTVESHGHSGPRVRHAPSWRWRFVSAAAGRQDRASACRIWLGSGRRPRSEQGCSPPVAGRGLTPYPPHLRPCPRPCQGAGRDRPQQLHPPRQHRQKGPGWRTSGRVLRGVATSRAVAWAVCGRRPRGRVEGGADFRSGGIGVPGG
jgi:hypothetical protein